MTPLYAGIGGVVRELTEMDAGINGVVTPLTEMWAGVGGVQRQIFSAAKPLDQCTPAEIQQIAQSGNAPNMFSVGDSIGITLNGAVGALTFSNETWYAFIIGFNHNASIEGNNTIHFEFGQTSGGTNIAFVDSNYGRSGSSAGFRVNTSNTDSGGWASSYMRNTICAAFLNAMPSAWQSVIAACTKYSDNTGGGSDTSSYVTSTSDKTWLLAEFEVQGACTYANSAEQNYQTQYAYYADGNSKVKYKNSATTYACNWWLRSVRKSGTPYFCFTGVTEGSSYANPYISYGFSPGFMVA